MPLQQALIDAFPEVIEQMKQEFSSHDLIRRLARDNQKLYIEALDSYRENSAPFRTLHSELAHVLHRFKGELEPLGERPSENIFGDRSPCTFWRKK